MFELSQREQRPTIVKMQKERLIQVSRIEDRIHWQRSAGAADLDYYWFRSAHPDDHLPLFVAVHGIRRRAFEHARLFAPIIDAIGGAMIAPLFGKGRFPGYQRLGHRKKGIRADLALQRLLDDVLRSAARPGTPVVMFGYSGGGQFVHRYAMAYPRQVKRMAVAAPGWFTLPDMRLSFPQGIKKNKRLPDLSFDASRFLRIPTMVLVGEKDTSRDDALNKQQGIDERQGRNRIERAFRWVKEMKKAAGRYACQTPYAFITVPGCGHSFTDCMVKGRMGEQIIEFLYNNDQSSTYKS